MLCEKYKSALIEAALTGAEIAPAVRAHVESCANCAAELASQQSLAAAIDANLYRQMNAPVSTAMLQRFEAHLAQQPQPKPAPRFLPIFAGTLATLATAATIVLLLPRHPPQINDAKRIVSQPTQNFVADRSRVDSNPRSDRRMTEVLSHQHQIRSHPHPRIVLASTAASSHTEPEVIVPPEERVAMEHFIADLHGEGEIALARAKRVMEQREQSIAPVDTPDIQIVALKVPPIRDIDVGSDK